MISKALIKANPLLQKKMFSIEMSAKSDLKNVQNNRKMRKSKIQINLKN